MATASVRPFSLAASVQRLKTCGEAFHSLHPSHKGTYSVERLRALRKYCNETSLFRVVFVLLTLPAPALLFTVLLECIPLKDPQDGWKANIEAWIRLGLVAVSVSTGLIIQTNAMVPLSKLSTFKTITVAAAASALYLVISCAVASTWVYPIPIGYILLAPVFSTLLVTVFLIAIGPMRFRENPELIVQLRKQLGIIMIQTSMCCIYPAFSALYYRLELLQQTALVFALPVIKILLQSAVVWFSSHIEEYIPGITVFSVEVFNALYLTKCMQSAKSIVTYVAIMLFDIVEMVFAFFDMKSQVSNLHVMQSQYNSNPAHNLLDTVLSVCQEPGVLDRNEGSFIRIRSSLRLRILKSVVGPTGQNQDLIDKQIQDTITTIVPTTKIDAKNQISPFTTRSSVSTSNVALAEKRKFVYDSLKVLFLCEYHVLVEYIESVVPMMYALYVGILCKLPSAQYYPETRDMTSTHVYKMALNVMGYAWMEILSFLALHWAVKMKFGFSPIHVLAFVLENQAIELQARLTVCFAYILPLTLNHFGVDFTLKFDWMHHH